MKKIFSFFLFFFILAVPFAKAGTTATDFKISYDISNFFVTTEKIHFEGFSFLDHMDNYGGKNMSTYIAAYTGDWDNEWVKPSKCNNSGKCYSKQVTVTDKYDLYFIRCIRPACTTELQEKRIRNLESGAEKYESMSCTEPGSESGVSYPNSHCAYHNVGFTIDLNFDDIKNKIRKDQATVHFRIITKAKSEVGEGHGQKKDSSDIGILSNSCKSVFGNTTCRENRNYKTTYKVPKTISGQGYNIIVKEKRVRSITLGGLSDEVIFTAGSASGSWKNEKAGEDSYANNLRSQYFNLGKKYKVTDVTEFLDGWKNWKGDGYVSGRLFKLEGNLENDANDYGWGWSAWVKSSGDLKMTIDDKVDESCTGCSCNDNQIVYCYGGNCNYNPSTCVSTSPSIENLSTSTNSGSHTSCSSAEDIKVSSDGLLEKVYWLNINKDLIDESLENNSVNYVTSSAMNSGANITNKLVLDGNYYWFPITLKALVNYEQTFNLKLNFSDGELKISSGRYFPFSFDYSTSVSTTGYNDNYDTSSNEKAGTSSYNTYQPSYLFEVVNPVNGEVSYRNIRIALKEGDKIFSSFYWPSATNYGSQLFKDIASTASVDLNNDQRSVNVTFPDTNNINQTRNDVGNFNCSSISECNYRIKQAWLSNTGDGKIIYGDKVAGYDITNGDQSLYYVSPNWKTNQLFTFSINASFGLPKTKFSYNATCSLKLVTNEIHDYVKYRSIDTSNPFPKGNIPKNWKQYIDTVGNLNRIESNPFEAEKISYQTEFIKDKNKFSRFKSEYGDYFSYGDMKSDGSGSSRIITSDLFNKITRTHCKAGEWSSSCDK